MTTDPVALLRVLAEHGVEHLVIGHAAAVLHGSPTVTEDVDVTPRRDVENAERLTTALTTVGARHAPAEPGGPPGAPVDERDFLGWRPLRYLTDVGPVDVVPEPMAIGGYEDLLPRAARFLVGGVEVLAAALDDVIASKGALDRPKDRAQLPALYATRSVLREREQDR